MELKLFQRWCRIMQYRRAARHFRLLAIVERTVKEKAQLAATN